MSHADRWHKQLDSGTKLTIISSAVLVYYLISKLWWIPSTLSNSTNTHDNVSRRLVLHRHPLPAFWWCVNGKDSTVTLDVCFCMFYISCLRYQHQCYGCHRWSRNCLLIIRDTWVHQGFSGVRVTRPLVLCVCFVDRCLSFCPFFYWPLCCLFFFDLWILITHLVSSSTS